MGFHFSNISKPLALIFSNILWELYIHLIFVEVLQMEKNSHFVESKFRGVGKIEKLVSRRERLFDT